MSNTTRIWNKLWKWRYFHWDSRSPTAETQWCFQQLSGTPRLSSTNSTTWLTARDVCTHQAPRSLTLLTAYAASSISSDNSRLVTIFLYCWWEKLYAMNTSWPSWVALPKLLCQNHLGMPSVHPFWSCATISCKQGEKPCKSLQYPLYKI